MVTAPPAFLGVTTRCYHNYFGGRASQNDCRWADKDFLACNNEASLQHEVGIVSEATKELGHSFLKSKQVEAIQAFVSGEDVFVYLPTG